MTEKIRAALSKDTTINVPLWLVISVATGLVSGSWALALRVSTWESALDQTISVREMDRAWLEAERMNPGFKAPDMVEIRHRNKALSTSAKGG